MRFARAKAGLALALGIFITTQALPVLENNEIQPSNTSKELFGVRSIC
jgi:hypothetical protein